MVKEKAAGVLIKAKDTGRILLLLRSDKVETPLTWGMVSGGIDQDEDILTGLKREIMEETMVNSEIIKFEHVEVIDNVDKDFYLFKGFTNKEFLPKLCDENLDWGWFNTNELPTPLYPELQNLIKKYG